MATRHEKVDTRALLAGRPGDTNQVGAGQRLEERRRVLEYWPSDLLGEIERRIYEAPPWRLLLQATEWDDVPRERVVAYVRGYLGSRRSWPSVDGMRRYFGRVSNHRGPDEIADQEAIF